jgi:hypothetical protein
LEDLGARLGRPDLTFDDLENWDWNEKNYATTALECATYINPEPTPTVGYEFRFRIDNQDFYYYQPHGGAVFWCSPQGQQALLAFGGSIVPLNPENPSVPAEPVVVPTANPFARCGVQPRLEINRYGRVRADGTSSLNIRANPSPDATLLAEIPPAGEFAVLEGPNCDTAFTYWKINYNGLVGWLAEGTNGEYYAEIMPLEGGGFVDTGCVQPTRLQRGMEVQVLEGAAPLNLRERPFPNATKLGEVPGAGVVQILNGPICQASYNYWQVNYAGITAWMAEADSDEYYVEPLGKVFALGQGVQVYLPFALAANADSELIADVTPTSHPAANYWEWLPQHVVVKLYNEQNVVIGTWKIFRANDYEAFYPASIPALREVLAQQNSAPLADFNATNLYLTNAVHLFRARESFIDLPDGGRLWRMVAGYAQNPTLPVLPNRYLALGLSDNERYFYQVDLNLALVGDQSPLTPATWEAVATAIQTQALPLVNNAQPAEFAPLVEELDNLWTNFRLENFALRPRIFAQLCGTLQTRLTNNAMGRVLPGTANNLRAEPNRESAKVGEIPGEALFFVTEGPLCDSNNGAWWRVSYENLRGWTLEGQGTDYWLEPADGNATPLPFSAITLPPIETLATLRGQAPVPTAATTAAGAIATTCAGFLPSRLVVGQRGRVLPGDANNVRAMPTSEAERLGMIAGGGEFAVLEGPTCGNNGAWWRVDHNGLIGWTLEGQGSSYWLEPVGN